MMKMEECSIVCRLEVAERRSLVDKSQKLSKDLSNASSCVDKNAISIVQATITIYVPPLLASDDSLFCNRSPSPAQQSTAAAAVQLYKAEVNKYVQSTARHTVPPVLTGSSKCSGSKSESDVASVVHSVAEPNHNTVETNNNNSEIHNNNLHTTDNRELLRKIAANYRILNRRDAPKRLTNDDNIMSRKKMKRTVDKHKMEDKAVKDTDIQEQTTVNMNTTSDETNCKDTNAESESTLTVHLDRSQFDNELNSLLDRTVRPSAEVNNNTPPPLQETERYSDDSWTSSTDSCRESTSSLEEYLKKRYAKHKAQGKCFDMLIQTRRQKELRKIQEECSQMTEEVEELPIKKRMSSKMKKKQALLATFRKSKYRKVKTNSTEQTNGHCVQISPTFSSSSDSESFSDARCARTLTSVHSESIASSASDSEYSSSSDAENHFVTYEIVANSETLMKDNESTIQPAVPSEKIKIRAVSSEALTKYLEHMKLKQRNTNKDNLDSETTTNNNAISTLGDDISARGVLDGQLMVTGDVANSVSVSSTHVQNNSISASDSVNTVCEPTPVPSSTVQQCSVSSSTRRIIRKPRRRRTSRRFFKHQNIRYIKPRKRVQLRKTFSPSFRNLVDKSIQISKQKGIPKMNKNGQTTMKTILRNVRKMKSPQRIVNASPDGNSTPFIVEADVHHPPGPVKSSCADTVSYKDHSIRTNVQHVDTANKNHSSSTSAQSNSTIFNIEQDCDAILPVEPAQPQPSNTEPNTDQPTQKDVSDIVISNVRSLIECSSDTESANNTQISVVPEYLLQPRKSTDANELQHPKWNELLTTQINTEQFQQLLINSYDDNVRLQNINRRLHNIHTPPSAANSAQMNIKKEIETQHAEQSACIEQNQNQQQQLMVKFAEQSVCNEQNQNQQQLMVKSNTVQPKRTYTRRQPMKAKQTEADMMLSYLQIQQQQLMYQLQRPAPPPYPGHNPEATKELFPNGRNVIHQHNKMIPQSYRSTLSHMANPTVPRLSTDTGQPTNPVLDLRYPVNNTAIQQSSSTDTLQLNPVKYSPSTTMPSPLQTTQSRNIQTEPSTADKSVQTSIGNEHTIRKILERPETRIVNFIQSPQQVHSSTPVPAGNDKEEATQVKHTISAGTQTAFDSTASQSESEDSSTMCNNSSDSIYNNTTVDVSEQESSADNKPTIRYRRRMRRYYKTQCVKFNQRARRMANRHNYRRRISSRRTRKPLTLRQDNLMNNKARTIQEDNKNKVVTDETTPVQNNNKVLSQTCGQDNVETADRMNIPVNFYTLSDQQPVYASTVINQGNEALQLTQTYIETVQNNHETMRDLQQSLRELIANVNTSNTVKGEHKSTTTSVGSSKISHTKEILEQFLSNQKNIRTEFVIRHELVTADSDQQPENQATFAKQKLQDSLEKLMVLLKKVRDTEPKISSASTLTEEEHVENGEQSICEEQDANEQHVENGEQNMCEKKEVTGQQDTINAEQEVTEREDNIKSSSNSSSSSSSISGNSNSSEYDEPAINVQIPWSVKQSKTKNTEQSECVPAVNPSLPSTSKTVPNEVNTNQSLDQKQRTEDNTTIANETQDTTAVSKDKRINVLYKYALSKLEERKLDNNKCIQQQQQQPPVINKRQEYKIVKQLLDNGVQIQYSIPVHRPDVQQSKVNNTIHTVAEQQNVINNNVHTAERDVQQNEVNASNAGETTPVNNASTNDVCKELHVDVAQLKSELKPTPQPPPSSTNTDLTCAVNGQHYPLCNIPKKCKKSQAYKQQVQTRVSTTTHNQNTLIQTSIPTTHNQPTLIKTSIPTTHNQPTLIQTKITTTRHSKPTLIVATNSSRLDISLRPAPVAQPVIERQNTGHMPVQLNASRIEDNRAAPGIHVYTPQSVTSEQRSSENELTAQSTNSTPSLNKRQTVITSAGGTRKRARTGHNTSYPNIPIAVPPAVPPAVPTAEPVRPADFLAAVNQRLNNTDNLIRTLIKKKDRKPSSNTATAEELASSSSTSLDSYNNHLPFNPNQTFVNQYSHYPTPTSYHRPVYAHEQLIPPAQSYFAGQHLRYRAPPMLPMHPPIQMPIREPSPLSHLATMVHEHPRTNRGRGRRRLESTRTALPNDRLNVHSTVVQPTQVLNHPEHSNRQRRNYTEYSSRQRRNHSVTSADSTQPNQALFRQFENFMEQSQLELNNHRHSGMSDSSTNSTILYPVVQVPPFPAEVLQGKQYNTLLSKYYEKPTALNNFNSKCQNKYGSLTDYNNNIITSNKNNNKKNKIIIHDVQRITYPYPRQLSNINGNNTIDIRYSNKKYVHTTQSNDTISDQSGQLVVLTEKTTKSHRDINSFFAINKNSAKHVTQMITAQLQVKQLNSFIENNRRMLLQDTEDRIRFESLNAYTVNNIIEIYRLFEIVILTDIEQYYRSLWCMWRVSHNKRLYYFYRSVTHLQIRIGQMPFAIRIFIDLLRRKLLCSIKKLTEDQYKR